MKITLPFLPGGLLSPNARGHWAAIANAKKEARAAGALYAHAAKKFGKQSELAPKEGEKLTMAIQPYFPDRRRRDLDNLHASMKAYLDGIADALGFDDSQIVETTLRKPIIEKGRREVVIYLLPIFDQK